MYLKLSESGSETSSAALQKMIGASTPGHVVLPTEPTKPKKRLQSLFVIDGEDIANAVFDVLETDAEALDANELRKMLLEEAAAIGVELSVKQIASILQSLK
jgi:hypothetical protein